MQSKTSSIAFIHKDSSAGRSLVQLAESAGLHANLYVSIDEFFAKAELNEIGCVVLDDSLSANVGDRLLAVRDRRKPQPFPIIQLSAADEERTRQRARDMGAAAFFREPVDGEALLDAIRWELGECDST